MKGTLKSRTATITMTRDEYINLWCLLPELIKKENDSILRHGMHLTTSNEVCKDFAKLIEDMYNDWYERYTS